jgi:YfiH family protein
MPIRKFGALRAFQFASLSDPGVIHGVFTRLGGVSAGYLASLNVGATVGDGLENVLENRKRLFDAMDRSLESMFDVWQVHSSRVVKAEAPRGNCPLLQADAIITDEPRVTLFMRFADCVPIFLFDPIRRAIGLVHAGWMGTLRNVAGETMAAMQKNYGCQPEHVRAAIGPSIAAHHYAIGMDVAERFIAEMGDEAQRHLHHDDGTVTLDLWSANQAQLQAAGVGQVELSGICTACDVQHWYSHRAEGGRTGRFGALLALRA